MRQGESAMKIAVIGLGKMGLPFAVQCASKEIKVFGCDVSENTVSLVNAGTEPFPGERDLQEKLSQAVSNGYLTATTNTVEAVSLSDVVVVLVPLYVDQNGRPDFIWMDQATDAIAQGLKPGTLVSYETTLPIGTTRGRFAAKLSEISGLTAGEDFLVAFSPERVYSGRVFENLRQYPKLTGGINGASESAAVDFYKTVLDFDDRPDLERPNGVWGMGSSEAAEFAKLAETTYRDVNIGLANQFAIHADQLGIDIYKVIEGCNSQPFSHIHRPGVAVGGHCIPVYPQLYLLGDPDASVVRAAREANWQMPKYVVDQLEKKSGPIAGKTVGILGVAYRGNVKEHAFSGVFDLVREVESHGGIAKVSDPLYSSQEIEKLGLPALLDLNETELIIVQADHEEYRTLDFSKYSKLTHVFDGRNFLPATGAVPVLKIGA
jgi:nucleotide sugar dehydrogenase